MLYSLARAALFKLDPEVAHDLTLKSLAALGPGAALSAREPTPRSRARVMGIDFPNPVGLAAGLDKNGDYIDALAALGFGFIEIGTVTPRPQPGNPSRACSAVVEHDAIINRLGFNNGGPRAPPRQRRARELPRRPRHQHRQELRHAARARRRRLPRVPGRVYAAPPT
jgi:dihydroorotate dehydrogenase